MSRYPVPAGLRPEQGEHGEHAGRRAPLIMRSRLLSVGLPARPAERRQQKAPDPGRASRRPPSAAASTAEVSTRTAKTASTEIEQSLHLESESRTILLQDKMGGRGGLLELNQSRVSERSSRCLSHEANEAGREMKPETKLSYL